MLHIYFSMWVKEILQVTTTIWGLQNINSPYQIFYILKMLFQPFQDNNVNSLS